MSVYQNDIKRIMKQLMLVYETRTVFNKDRKLERFGVIELMILELVHSSEQVTQIEILDTIKLKRTKLLGILKKLMEHNYLCKEENPHDKRSYFIKIGKHGEEILKEYETHEAVFLDFVLRDMTINEEKAIVKFLSKIQQTDYMK